MRQKDSMHKDFDRIKTGSLKKKQSKTHVGKRQKEGNIRGHSHIKQKSEACMPKSGLVF